MATQTFARSAGLVLVVALAVAGCGVRGQTETGSPSGSISSPATSTNGETAVPPAATPPAAGPTEIQPGQPTPVGPVTLPPTRSTVGAPDISADLQAVDGLLSGVGGDVRQGDDAIAAGD